MCANQRSAKRNQLVGAYITPELKERAVFAAKGKGLTVADKEKKEIKMRKDPSLIQELASYAMFVLFIAAIITWKCIADPA